jgi:hypothetical protein
VRYIRIKVKTVSRVHCKVRREASGTYVLENASTTNFTVVNRTEVPGRNDGKCAVKQMETIFDERTDAKRAYREIRILRQVNHPNIIGLLDVVFTEVRTAAQGAALLQAEEMARAAAYDSSPSRIGSMGDGEEAASGTEGASVWGGAISAGSGSRGKVKPGAYHSPLDEIRHGNLCRLVG